MSSLFNYNTLNVNLDASTKGMKVELNRNKDNAINLEMVFELETLFIWLSHHLEVQSVYLTGSGNCFSSGLDSKEIKKMSDDKFKKMLKRLQKFSYYLFFVPQTIIIDFKSKATGVAVEISAGADLRIARKDVVIKMDYLERGFVPNCGGIGLLGEMIPKHYLRRWFMLGSEIDIQELVQSGLVQECYNKRASLKKYQNLIFKQASIPRIQCKRALLENVLPEISRALDYEQQIAFAGMHLGDWREYLNAEEKGIIPDYASARMFSQTIKFNQNDHWEN
ncbi:MAG: enoyl-CoA hydratase/isomerase family protein [Halobacteriovoraceae bacterium]|nr:enoyl-CoA hydratase/isomerase family protein [Halobacteriovoraceae bacterium]